MAKGKTNAPLVIEVSGKWYGHPAVEALGRAGHTIRLRPLSDVDWVMDEAAGWSELFFTQHTKEDGTVHRPFVEARLKCERDRKRRAKR